MRMVRLSRDASKQDEARELLAPVYRSVEPRPFFPHSSTMPGPELPMRKPTTSFARSTDGDRLLTVIIDQQICLMLHDGEKGKLDLAVGLSQWVVPMCATTAFTMSDRGRRRSATRSPPATLARARGGLQHRNTQCCRSAFCRRRSCRFTASLSETDAPEKQ
jgi:hypothetical protein